MTFEANIEKAGEALARFRRETLPHFIAGKHDPGRSGKSFPNATPADGTSLGQVAAGSAPDVAAAVSAARDAFTAWAATPGRERRALLHRLADLILARREEIALVESMDTGQAIRFMDKAALRGAENFRFFADKAPEAQNGLSLPADQHLNYTLRQPIGPVAVITPWNTPFMLSTWKIAPALAAGCTVVHKPAEWSPCTALLLAELAFEAGLPGGVLNTVNGLGERTGRALTEHPEIRAVAFVGESRTGSAIQAQGAPTLKRLHFELGGKNPVIVFADADLERALDAVVFMIFSLNGERCTSSSRLLVQQNIHDEFVERISRRISKLRVGHPLDPATEIGPLIHRKHFEKVTGYLDAARAEALDVRNGGGGASAHPDGNYLPPALICGATRENRVAREEIFGPVLTVIPFDDEDEAVQIANDVAYGLAGYIWTQDIGRAHRLARKIEAGMIWINSENNRHLPTPFGGIKASGIGRDGGDWSFDFYMETKNVCVALGTHAIPTLGKA